jgi:DNA invertase Pin-like site-specific DNA recombinase
MQMLAFLAEFERAMIPERTPLLWLTSAKAGLAGAARSSTLSETARDRESGVSGRKSGAEMALLYEIN